MASRGPRIRNNLNLQRTTVWLPDKQRKGLKAVSERTAAPVSALIRKAIDEFLKRQRVIESVRMPHKRENERSEFSKTKALYVRL